MRILDGVPIKTSRDGKFCSPECPLMSFDYSTICALEKALTGRSTMSRRYNTETDAYERCPQCNRRERRRRAARR